MGSTHNDDTWQGITKILLFASFEAGRCGKHAYCKDIYVSLVRSLLEYARQVWHTGLTVSDSARLEGIQKRAMKIAFPELPYECAFTLTNINTLHSRREDLSRRFFRGKLSPSHKRHHLLPPPRLVSHNFRKKTQFPAPRTRTTRYQRTLIPYGLVHWQ